MTTAASASSTSAAALAARPIGMFDSGIGGLTVARAVARRLPHEQIVYFGDTAHLPYGDKSAAAIQAYSVKICDLIIKMPKKLFELAERVPRSGASAERHPNSGSEQLVRVSSGPKRSFGVHVLYRFQLIQTAS